MHATKRERIPSFHSDTSTLDNAFRTPVLYTCQVVHPYKPPPATSFRDTPFITLSVAELYDVLEEVTCRYSIDLHVQAKIGYVAELLLIRDRTDREVGWALPAFLKRMPRHLHIGAVQGWEDYGSYWPECMFSRSFPGNPFAPLSHITFPPSPTASSSHDLLPSPYTLSAPMSRISAGSLEFTSKSEGTWLRPSRWQNVEQRMSRRSNQRSGIVEDEYTSHVDGNATPRTAPLCEPKKSQLQGTLLEIHDNPRIKTSSGSIDNSLRAPLVDVSISRGRTLRKPGLGYGLTRSLQRGASESSTSWRRRLDDLPL